MGRIRNPEVFPLDDAEKERIHLYDAITKRDTEVKMFGLRTRRAIYSGPQIQSWPAFGIE